MHAEFDINASYWCCVLYSVYTGQCYWYTVMHCVYIFITAVMTVSLCQLSVLCLLFSCSFM